MACIVDTASINLTVAAGQLSADLIVDPGAGLSPNPLIVNAAGVYVIGSDGWIPLPTTLAFSSADGHTYVATTSADLRSFIGAGDKIRLVQSGVPAYFFVTAIAAGTITLYGGTDYVLAALPITLPYFSKVKSPIGFPLLATKWTEILTDTTDRSQAGPVTGTWYNPGSLSLAIPIGAWRAKWQATLHIEGTMTATGGGYLGIQGTLSTANNSQSDAALTAGLFHYWFVSNGNPGQIEGTEEADKVITLAVKTSHFLNIRTDRNASFNALALYLMGSTSRPSIISAECAYL